MSTIADVRPSPIAGRWYSANPAQLAHQIDAYLADVTLPQIEGQVLAIITPHAGHRYSGRTAAYAFKSIAGHAYNLAAVISPLHGFHPAALLTSAHRRYATPLGELPIDARAIKKLGDFLAKEGNIRLESVAYDEEHSLEIELPFLQRVLPDGFSLLPVMARSHEWRILQVLGQGLANVANQTATLLVASSDLSHFYPERTANVLDQELLKRIVSLDPKAVLAAEAEGVGFACGAGAIAAVMAAAVEMGANAAQILHHSTSADETGDLTSVVGYGSVVILKRD
ncbi:MAG: AmmeMemoRadiSam system protein B [Chloroflexi bacterium]|nr:MAG: AmmeMemoRadiSam system protein B [Chloroflexota bacterium]